MVGWKALTRRYIPASLGVRPPFLRLQPLHAATQFSKVVFPPRERGMIWSIESRSRGLPQ